MRLQKALSITLLITLALGFSEGLSGQDAASMEKENPMERIPAMAGKHRMALGRRMSSIGREKTVYTGQLFDRNNKPAPARITQDIFGLARLEGFRADEILSFDGKKIRESSDSMRVRGEAKIRADEDLMEVFVMDSVEGMMESLRKGAAVRYLGSGFRPHPRLNPEYNGPRYDIYEVTAPVRCRRDHLVRTKLYYFDSATGLLVSTRYYDRSGKTPVKMETRFSVWGEMNGSKYPARIEHYAGGKLQFDFIAEGIQNEESAGKTEYGR